MPPDISAVPAGPTVEIDSLASSHTTGVTSFAASEESKAARVLAGRELAQRLLKALKLDHIKMITGMRLDMQGGRAACLTLELLVTEPAAAALVDAVVQLELVPQAMPGAPVSAVGPAGPQR